MDSVRDTLREVVTQSNTPRTGPDPAIRQRVERDLFLPGQKTVARSDRESNPVKFKEIMELMREPFPKIRKRRSGHPPSQDSKTVEDKVYPDLKEILATYKEYKNGDRISVRTIGLVCISGCGDDESEEQVYLQLGVDGETEPDAAQASKLASEVRHILEREELSHIHCLVIMDKFEFRPTASYFAVEQ